MKIKFATSCLLIGTFLAPITTFATDVYIGTANNQTGINEAIAMAHSTENVKSVWSDLSVENDR